MSEYEPFPPREVSAAAARLLAENLHARAHAAHEAAKTALADDITVLTTSGWVRGCIEEELRPDRPISSPVRSWRGIPFGADTSGDQRSRNQGRHRSGRELGIAVSLDTWHPSRFIRGRIVLRARRIA